MVELPQEGRTRAVIDAVRPSVDGGRFAVKRVVGDTFTVEADCFADGHDALRVVLRWRPELEGDWREVEMESLGNDVWRGAFALDTIGRYRYTVTAWADALLSWRTEFMRREDLEDLRVAARIGADLVEKAAASRAEAPFLDGLAAHGEIIAPSHPGFGASALPPDFDTVYDLVNLYLAVLDSLPADDVTVIGFSFGGWIAAELAVTNPRKLGSLVLVDPVGIKIGGREERDITHFFNTDPHELNRRSWHDPARRPAGVYGLGWQATISEAMSDQEMITLARN